MQSQNILCIHSCIHICTELYRESFLKRMILLTKYIYVLLLLLIACGVTISYVKVYSCKVNLQIVAIQRASWTKELLKQRAKHFQVKTNRRLFIYSVKVFLIWKYQITISWLFHHCFSFKICSYFIKNFHNITFL